MAKKKNTKPAKKSTVKKSAKKSAPKAKPAKKAAAKKPAVKKAASKKSAPKKAVLKKAVKKSAPVKKVTLAKKTKPVAKASAPVPKATAKPAAKVDYTKAITPLGDRLVVRLVQAEKISAGGIILLSSTTGTDGYLKGEVLAAGHGTYTKKGHHKLLDVKIGDIVLFSDYTSTKVKFNNEDLHIVHENEVLGVTEK